MAVATLVTEQAPIELWQDLVREAEDHSHRHLGEELQSYLVFTLHRFTQDQSFAHRVIALDFLAGLARAGRAREGELRDVGDRCLLLAGLYPEQARRRLVPLSYFVGIGASAYDEAASALRSDLSQLFSALARSFHALVTVLLQVRKLSGQWLGLDGLQRFELCQIGSANKLELAAEAFPGAIVLANELRTIQ